MSTKIFFNLTLKVYFDPLLRARKLMCKIVSVDLGGKVLTPAFAKEFFEKKINLKRKSLDDVIQVMKKIQKTTGINVQRPHIISNLQAPKDIISSSSSMRKLMSPTKTSVSMFGQTQTSMSGHYKGRTLRSPHSNTQASTSYKRPLDVSLEQNGIDGNYIQHSIFLKLLVLKSLSCVFIKCSYCGS